MHRGPAYQGTIGNVRLICGRSNLELGELISKNLRIPLVNCCLEDFANKELRVEIHDNIRGRDVFILQTGSSDNFHSINDYLMEMLAITDACRRSSARTITAIIPYYWYCRSDKKDAPRVPIMAKVVTNMLTQAGVERIVSIDLHAGQIQGFADYGWDNLFCLNIFVDYMMNTLFKGLTQEEINEKYILISPDNGGAKRVKAYAEKLKMNHEILNKKRNYKEASTVMSSTLTGDPEMVKGKKGIIIDDIIDTMGTMTSAADVLMKHGLTGVIIIATHGIFSGPAFKRIAECDAIEQVIVTNTLPQKQHIATCKKLTCVDTSGLLSETIQRLVEGSSISELFN